MSTHHNENKLIQALKEITAEERRQQLDELLSIVGDDAEGLLRMIQEGGSAAEFTQVRSVTELRGLGKEVWQGGDAQSYVDAERESWHR